MKRMVVLLAGLAGLAERIGSALQWLSPALARLTVGLVFLQSGWGKLHDLEKVTNYFTQLGLAAPAFQARLASTAEFVCGGLLLVGFATRFAAVPLIVTMCVAISATMRFMTSSSLQCVEGCRPGPGRGNRSERCNACRCRDATWRTRPRARPGDGGRPRRRPASRAAAP